MISGGVGVFAFERLYSTSDGLQNADPFALTPGNVFVHSAVDNDGRRQLLSSPLPRDTVKSATDLSYALHHQYLSLKKEGGVQVWRARDFSSSRGVPVSRQWPIGEIAAADGASEEIVIDEGQQVWVSGSVEADTSVDKGGLKFDLIEGIKDLGRKAEIVKEQVNSLDYSVSPTPFSPVEGPEAIKFGVISVGLLFFFWLGNYYVPDLIFKNTVFRKDPEDPIGPTGDQESPRGLKEATKTSEGDVGSSAIRSGTGFSPSTKQNKRKSGKRK